MGNAWSKSPVLNILLIGMSAKQEAIFRMAFKMHTAGTRYVIADQSTGDWPPNLAIVDVDGPDGMTLWKKFKAREPDLAAIYSSIGEPDFAIPYLAKPVKVETLFPLIRAVIKGEGVFDPVKKKEELKKLEQIREARQEKVKQKSTDDEQKFVVRRFERKEQLPTANIEVFDINTGLLGSLRRACGQARDVALIYDNKPVLIVFPSVQKILLAAPPDELKRICCQDGIEVETKFIADNPSWRENAKVSFESCLWQFSIWSAHGRLIGQITPDTLMRLKGWPNLTRLAHIPDAMRLSAFMTQTTTNLHILYKILRVDLADLLNFVAANYVIGLLITDLKSIQSLSEGREEKAFGSGFQEDGVVVRQKYKAAQSTGMLQRLMSRLSVKKDDE